MRKDDMNDMPDSWAQEADRKDRAAIDTIAMLVRSAVAENWTVYHHHGATHMRAIRNLTGRTIQVSAAVIDGQLKASRVEILDETVSSDQVAAWLELSS